MKNYGLIIVPRDPLDYEHKLGASKIHKEIRQPDGQWTDDVPDGEIQMRNNVETMNCTNFGTYNILEIIEYKKYGTRSNHSERALGIASGTTNQGNDPKKVAQAVRNFGAIPEEILPFSNDIKSFDEYYSPKPLPSKYIQKGKDWLKNWDMGYEWVTPTPENLMEELHYAPVGIAVEAWQQDEKGYYYGGENPNHWTVLVGYEKGDYWVVYDSYPETSGSYIKLLKWDYKFQIAMSYSLKKKSQSEKSWFQNILDFLNEIFYEYMKRRY